MTIPMQMLPCLQVLDMAALLEPIVAEAREAAIQKAKEEAESSAIATLTQELSQQESGTDGRQCPLV